MGTGYFSKDSMLSPSELEEKGIKAKKNHVYFANKDGSIKTFKYSDKEPDSLGFREAKQVPSSVLEKIANSTGLGINKIKNHIGSMIRHFKQGTKGIERKNRGGAIKKAKGGIVQVQKFSRGGTVERPRGVGIAKRGYGKVMR